MISSADILKARILVVDDREDNLDLLEQVLRLGGYTSIDVTSNPREVCDLHRQNHYSLILLDLEMPGMDGFEVMEDLKRIELEAGNYLPVLAITANHAHKLRALENGAKDFISKPFDSPEMLRRVYNLLEVRLLHDETRSQHKMLAALALQDPLTGLANRRLLLDRMSVALSQARRSNGSMAVMYLDLDGFKEINDTLGHGAGDILLKAVAARLTGSVRAEDTVARLGGDEFVMTLAHVHSAVDLAAMAAKVIEAVAQPYDVEGRIVRVTASAGLAIYPNGDKDAESLLKSADRALYEAKLAGKNTYRIDAHSLSGDNAQAARKYEVRLTGRHNLV
jgi:two-component system, cell cycle response regulator